MYATQVSLLIGLVSVVISLVLGVLLGGISGYVGGTTDTVIQRVIEILRSIPTIPLWMGLAASVPKDWDIVRVFFVMTLIFSLFSWTELARVVRGRFLSLRHEDFVTAAELVGCSRLRIIFRHLVPSFLSHIIAATTLALPGDHHLRDVAEFPWPGHAPARAVLGRHAASSLQRPDRGGLAVAAPARRYR